MAKTKPTKVEDIQQNIAANIQAGNTSVKREENLPKEPVLQHPVQAEAVDIGQAETPVTDPKQSSENFLPGGETGMSGEPLPSIQRSDGTKWMATMFDQYGKPYWGDIDPDPNFWGEVSAAMKNWWGNVVYDFQNKDTTPIEIIQDDNWDTIPESFKQAGVAITDKTGTFGEDAGKALAPVMQTVGEAISTAGRAWTNGERLTLPYGIGYVLKGVKHLLGGGMEVLGGIGYGVERLVGTVVIKAKMGEDISGYEAWAASRIAYSSLLKEGLTAEYLRRYRNGENPILLMQELQNPLAEMAGQSVLDPLNLLSLGAAGAAKAGAKGVMIADDGADLLRSVNAVTDVAKAERIVDSLDNVSDVSRAANMASDTARVVDDVGDAARTANTISDTENIVEEVVDSAKVVKKAETPTQKLSSWIAERVKIRTAEQVKSATQRSIFSPVSTALQARLVDKMHDAFTILAKSKQIRTMEDFGNVVHDMLKIVAGTDAERLEAVARISKMPEAQILLGDDMLDAFLGFKQMFSNADGIFDIKGITKLLESVKGDGANALTFLTDKLSKRIENAAARMFPSIVKQAEQAKAVQAALETGQDIPAYMLALAKNGKLGTVNPALVRVLQFHEAVQKNLVGPINRFFAFTYMGINPAFATRNYLTNMFHIGVDHPDALLGGFKYSGARADRILNGWGAGHLATIGFKGGGIENTVEGKSIWDRMAFSRRWNAKVEAASAKMVAAKTMDKEMRKMWKVMMQDAQGILADAGFTPAQVEAIKNGTWDNYGDVWKAIKDTVAGEQVDLGDFLSVDQIAELHKAELDDVILDIVRQHRDDPAEMKRVLRQTIEERRRLADRANAQEAVGKAPDGIHREVQDMEDDLLKKLDELDEDSGNYEYDLLSRKNLKKDETVRVYQNAFDEQTDQINRTLGSGGDYQKLNAARARRDTAWKTYSDTLRRKTQELHTNIEKAIGDIIEEQRAGKITEAEAAIRKHTAWKKFYSTKEKLNSSLRQKLFEEYDGALADLKAAYPNVLVEDSTVLKAQKLAEECGQMDKADKEYFRSTGKLRVIEKPKSTPQTQRATELIEKIGDGKATQADVDELSDLAGLKRTLSPEDAKKLDALQERRAKVHGELEKWRSKSYKTSRQEANVGKNTPTQTRMNVTDINERRRANKVAELERELSGIDDEISGLRPLDVNDAEQMDDFAYRAGNKVGAQIAGDGETQNIGAHIKNPTPEIPTQYDMAQETVAEIERTVNMVIDSLGNYTPKRPIVLTASQEKALSKFGKIIEGRMATARATAMKTSGAARKFTLLDYRDKRGIDSLLAYAYPYQYWYSRTYGNWMKRIVKNPYLGATYGRYRDYMEKIHAGMPEWYRYQVNTNELLGIDSDNPLYFNLEATLNPLNGIIGVDFDDPQRRESAFGATVDGLGKFGPSVWTPVSMAVALDYWIKGNPESASVFAGRMVPITSAIKGASAMMGVKGNNPIITPAGIELDPLMLMQGGMSNYDRRRVGRTLGQMVSDGVITIEQADDAAYQQSGEIWDMAMQYSVNNPEKPFYSQRGFSQAMGGLVGVGFKGRNTGDALIDKAYSEMNAIMLNKPNMSPEKYSMAWQRFKERYPFMETVMLSRKSDDVRDEAYVWAVLNRIPPGSQDNIMDSVGLSRDILNAFYDNKGLAGMAETDKMHLLASARDIGLVLAVPDGTTSHEWAAVRARNSMLNRYTTEAFGSDTKELVDQYYQVLGTKDYSKAEMFLQQHPVVQNYLQYRQQVVLADRLLSKYYGGLDYLENYYRSQFYREAGKRFGAKVFEELDGYYYLKDNGGDTAQYLRDFPNVKEYWNLKDGYDGKIAEAIDDASDLFPEQPKPLIRTDAQLNSVGAQDILKGISETTPDEDNAALLMKYQKSKTDSSNGHFSISAEIDRVAEERWPGILTKYENFKSMSMDTAKARKYYNDNPDIAAYENFGKSMRNLYNNTVKGNFDQAEKYKQLVIMSQIDEYTYELIKLSEGNPPSVVVKLLNQIGLPLGMTAEEVLSYIP